jgi:HEAT repeat protein
VNLFGPNINKMEKKGDIEGLCQVLRHEKGSTREKAALALDRLAWKPQDDINKAWYFAAKRNWQELADLGEPAIAPLVLALQHPEEGVRKAAGDTLEQIALFYSDSAVPLLCEALCDQLIEIRTIPTQARNRIVKILGKTGDARAVLPLIRSIIRLRNKVSILEAGPSPNPLLVAHKDLAIQAIKDIGEPAITPLIEALSSDGTDTWLRSDSSSILPLLGTPTVAPLIKLLDRGNKKVRYGAIEALSRIDDDRIIEQMVKSLQDDYQFVRTTAFFYLRNKSWQPTNPEEKAYYLLAEILVSNNVEGFLSKAKTDELVAMGEEAVNPLVCSLCLDGNLWKKGYSVGSGLKVPATQYPARHLVGHLA